MIEIIPNWHPIAVHFTRANVATGAAPVIRKLNLARFMLPTAALLVWALVATPAFAETAVDLSGEWYFDVTSQNGPGRREVIFRQDDQRLIGFIESDSASGRFVGQVTGSSVEFTAVLEFGGEPMAAVYRATLTGNTMSGTIDFGLYGRATFIGYRGRRPQASQSADASSIEGSARSADIDAASDGDLFGLMHDDLLLPEMLAIPAGRFRMGNNGPTVKPEFGADFSHVHTVGVSAFRMSRLLVTNAQYQAFSTATKREAPLPPKGWSNYVSRHPNHPVVNVNHDDAVAYTTWLSTVTGASYRLPTEAEWEYAARSGVEGDNFVFGNEWEAKAANTATWHIGKLVDRDGWKTWWDGEGDRLSKSQPMTTRVGSFAPTAWGLYDMAGNVWQWTADWYQADYYQVSPELDPAGPATGSEKVLRGCSWYNQPDVCFVATRDRYAPDRRLYYNGFRVVAEGE